MKWYVGLNHYRTRDNPMEKVFADAWAREGERLLAYLLNHGETSPWPSDRDYAVAATVIQWLGSPVGQCFLRDAGWVRMDEVKP